MQVHVYLEGDDAETLVVEIPSSDGNLVCRFTEADLVDADHDNPLVGQMPEPTGSTVYSKPIGEMPLKVQEEYTRKVQEENESARVRASQDVQGDLGSEGAREPADANTQLGAVDPVTLEPDPADKGPVSAGAAVDKSKSGNKPSGAKR